MEWERWTVKSRRKKESVDDGIGYTIKSREQNRHHLEYPMSATEVMITHYTMDSAKFILDKMVSQHRIEYFPTMFQILL
jgi:hypothetical protein